MNENLLALKPYLESIEEHCSHLSTEELLEIILGLSKEIPPKKRIDFLAKIESLSQRQMVIVSDEGILEQIEALKEDIEERAASIEDGSFYDDYNGWDYDEEEPDLISEEQKEELEAFFEDAANLFLSGRLDAAREVYASLFDLLHSSQYEEGEYFSFGISDYSLNVELREERARHCRCVYETTPAEQRAQAMLEAMDIRASLSKHFFDIYENNHPMLLDVMNSKPGELADWERFLAEWKKELSKESSDRAALLLLEAVNLLEGLDGIESLVRSWGARQPRGYLFWIQALVCKKDWQNVASVAEEALTVLPHGHFRAQTAEHLIRAGEMTNRGDLILRGKRELFYSLPDDTHLLLLTKESERHEMRASELEKAVEFLSANDKEEKTLLVKALLMAGRVGTAFEKAKRSQALGWSYGDNAGAVLFGGILSALTLDRIEEAGTIRCIMNRYVDKSTNTFLQLRDAEKLTGEDLSMSDEILTGLKGAVISGEEQMKYLSWAIKIGKRRIDQIVSNKHRKAYARAAEVLGALAECFLLRGEREKGRKIVEEFRDQRYNRYPAFRREVNAVISASSLLSW